MSGPTSACVCGVCAPFAEHMRHCESSGSVQRKLHSYLGDDDAKQQLARSENLFSIDSGRADNAALQQTRRGAIR